MRARLQAGFTLIELIVILVIIGILAVVALPRLGNERAFSERGFRDGLVATLGHAQRMAVASRRFVCVNVDGGAGVVTLTRDARVPDGFALNTAVNCGQPLDLPSSQDGCGANQLCVPAGVIVNGSGTTTLFFDPLGRLVGQNAPRTGQNGTVNIAVSNQPPIQLDLATGHAR